MLKIKKEKKIKCERVEGEELGSDESYWEPEAEVMLVQRKTRSGRQRKSLKARRIILTAF